MTERHDDDGVLVAETDQDTQIIPATPARAARAAAARSAAAAKEVLANVKSATANGGSAAEEKDAAADGAPALPADTIGLARDSSGLTRPVSGPGADGDGTSPTAAESAPIESAPIEPAPAEPAAAQAGTGWQVDSTLPDAGAGTARPGWPAAQPSGGPEPAVSAAAFVWDPPEPAPTSPSSPARNFLRSSTGANTSAAPRTPPVSLGPAKGAGGAVPGGRPRRPAKRSARQAHLAIARLEPWSVMKFSFVVSLVAFVIIFVAVSVIYGTLSTLGVFTSLQHLVQNVTSSQNSGGVNVTKWFTASRVLGYTALLGAVNIVLITAMCTIGAVVYNLTSRLIGGVEVTLRETE